MSGVSDVYFAHPYTSSEMATAETEEYLNAKQAAVFLGWKLQTLYNRIHDIPHTKNGKSLIFTKSALRKFMERK